MVITPTLRGLFGISVDALSKKITIDPHLPATWDHAEVRNLPIGSDRVDLVFTRAHGALSASLRGPAAASITLGSPQKFTGPDAHGLRTFTPQPVAIGPYYRPPLPGSRTESVRILNETTAPRQLTLTLQGLAGAQAEFPVVLASPTTKLHAEGADLATPSPARTPISPSQSTTAQSLTVHFPPGQGWQTQTVTLTW